MNQTSSSVSPLPSCEPNSGSLPGNKRSPAKQTDKNHVKRPLNPFIVWSKIERKKILAVTPDMHNADISKQLGLKWSRLSPDERLPFIVEAERLRQLHFLEHPDYKYKPKKKELKVLKRPRTKDTFFSKQRQAYNILCNTLSNNKASGQPSSKQSNAANVVSNESNQQSPKSDSTSHNSVSKLSSSKSPRTSPASSKNRTSIQPSPKSRSSPASKETASIQPSPKSKSSPASKKSASIQPSPKSRSSPASKESALIQPSPKSRSSPASKETASIQPSPKSKRSPESEESASIQPSPKSRSPASKETASIQPSPKSRRSPASKETASIQPLPKSRRSPASEESASIQPSPKSRSSPASKENSSIQSPKISSPSKDGPTSKRTAPIQHSPKSPTKDSASKISGSNQSSPKLSNTSFKRNLFNESSGNPSYGAEPKRNALGLPQVNYEQPSTFVKSSTCTIASDNIELQNSNLVEMTMMDLDEPIASMPQGNQTVAPDSYRLSFNNSSGECSKSSDRENKIRDTKKLIEPITTNSNIFDGFEILEKSSFSSSNKSSSLKKNEQFHIDGSLTAGSICAIACTSKEITDALDTFDFLSESLICSVKNIEEEIETYAKVYQRINNEGKYASYKKYSFAECVFPKLSDVLGRKWNDIACKFVD